MEENVLMKIEQTKQELLNIVNGCGLPIFVLEPMVKDLHNELANIRNNMLQQEIEASNKQPEAQEES